MNAIYYLSEGGKRKKRKQVILLTTFLFALFPLVAIIGRDRLFPGEGEATLFIPILLVLQIGVIVFLVRRRIPTLIDSQAVLLTDGELSLMQDGKVVISVPHDKIERVEVDGEGSIFVTGPNGGIALYITSDYTDIEGLRVQLSLLHGIQPRTGPSFSPRQGYLRGILLLVPAVALYIADSPTIVSIAAVVALCMIGWNVIEIWKAHGFGDTGRRFIGITTLFAAFVIIRTLVVLGLFHF